jgi:hypothetical protein
LKAQTIIGVFARTPEGAICAQFPCVLHVKRRLLGRLLHSYAPWTNKGVVIPAVIPGVQENNGFVCGGIIPQNEILGLYHPTKKLANKYIKVVNKYSCASRKDQVEEEKKDNVISLVRDEKTKEEGIRETGTEHGSGKSS